MSKDKVPYSKVSKGSIPSKSSSTKKPKINTNLTGGAGKGDSPRPVNAQTYTDNYDEIKWD
tara:strand:+ start:752 stop:934 length:183 start_codon:yes stop_codon:yes gene_type:complete